MIMIPKSGTSDSDLLTDLPWAIWQQSCTWCPAMLGRLCISGTFFLRLQVWPMWVEIALTGHSDHPQCLRSSD